MDKALEVVINDSDDGGDAQAMNGHSGTPAIEVAHSVDNSDNQSKQMRREVDSSSEKAPSVKQHNKIIGSEPPKTGSSMFFPTCFKLNVEYGSLDQIFRLLKKDEVTHGLPPRYMKEVKVACQNSEPGLTIKCRLCMAYIDFKSNNGKYTISILRNKHSHGKDTKPAPRKQPPKEQFPMPMILPSSSMNHGVSLHQNGFLSVKQQPREPTSNNFKSLLEKMKSNSNLNGWPQPTTSSHKNDFSMSNNSMIKQSFNKFQPLESFLISEGHQLIIEQGREPSGNYPEIILVISETMKRNYSRFGDLVSFHVCEQQVSDTSEAGHNFKVGVFLLTGHNLKLLLAGIVFFCRSTAAATRTLFEFFLKAHNKQPESISTNHSKEVCLALTQLQDEGIYRGIHIIDPRQAIQNLENSFKTRTKVTRQILDLCSKVVMERNRCQATKIISEIEELIEAEDDNTQKATHEFLNQKQKICVSSLPPAFLGLVNLQNINKTFQTNLAKKTASRPQPIDMLCKSLLAMDGEMLDESLQKLKIFEDPIEQVFDDDRLRIARQALDTNIFKCFLQNYITAVTVLQLREIDSTGMEIENFKTIETFKIQEWNCNCDEKKKTGLPCSHILFVASQTPGMNYLPMISRRWRETEMSEVHDSDLDDSMDGDVRILSTDANEVQAAPSVIQEHQVPMLVEEPVQIEVEETPIDKPNPEMPVDITINP